MFFKQENMSKDKNQRVRIGSSETTRETLLTPFCFKKYIELYAPQHKTNIDTTFLEWFVGFFEAEGCLLKWVDKSLRFGIEITQKDGSLIHKMRSELGFGNVTEYKKRESSETYWRYYAQNLESLTRLIFLLNGNLITEKKQDQFQIWLAEFNTSKKKEICFLPNRSDISLRDSWLSGFLEGDGGFWAKSKDLIRFNKKDNKPRYNIKMRFYVTQRGEISLLNLIKELFKIETKIHVITNGRTKEKYNRIETSRLDCHLIVVEYLKRYPFRGRRNVTFFNWERILQYRTSEYPITDKAIAKLRRLIEKTKRECEQKGEMTN